MTSEEQMEILNRVQAGELSVEEAARLLGGPDAKAQSNVPGLPGGEIQESKLDDEAPQVDLGWWKYAWMVPLWIGIGILTLGAWLLSWGYANERYFWFYCSWVPLLLGLFILLLGVWSQQARWVHIRIKDSGGTRISISLPIPIRLAAWLLKTFGSRIPELEGQKLKNLPDLIRALADSPDPIMVDINDKDGDQVKVYVI